MRTCANCGAQFRDDELICPVCGQEVQLVPDYVTIESHYQESELKREEEEREKQEEQDRQDAIEERRKQMHRNIILTVCLVIAAIAAIICFVVFARVNKNSNSYEYQYSHAESAYQTADYEDALKYIQQALKLNDSSEAKLLEAQIYLGMKDYTTAETKLLGLIEESQENTAAYELLFSLYQTQNETDKIEQLLANCTNKEVLKTYSDYLANVPSISPEGGEFDTATQVTISSKSKGTIYYTTDGSDPDENSTKYTAPFELGEGTTEVKAVIITKNGMASEIAGVTFDITFETPDAPKISPISGTYKKEIREDTDTSSDSEEKEEKAGKITVTVPDGYTCYYAFDAVPNENSKKYTKPVDMKKGEHVFYAVLQSKEGKMGKIASATYIYSEVTITPTPTPTPASQHASTTYNSSQTYSSETVETPTPTPTPTDTPTPTPTEAPSTPSPTPTEAPEPTDVAS